MTLKPQVLENCPVRSSRTALFFDFLNGSNFADGLKFFSGPLSVEMREKNFEDLFFVLFFGDRLKNYFEDTFFLGEHLRLCP